MATSSTGHDEQREQAALYTIGALTPADRRAFETHLAECEECTAEVQSLSHIPAALAQAVPQQDPPKSLRARVLAAVGENAARPPRAGASRRPLAATSVAWLASAAMLTLAIGLGVYAASLRSRIDALELRLRAATARADASERQMADFRRVATETVTQMAVLVSPDLQRIDLAGQPVAPQASGRAFWSRSRGLVFTASRLPPLPAGKAYQLWILTPAPAPVSAGVFKPDQSGGVVALFAAPVDLVKPTAVAVPTGDRYLVGT
jgi:anti-sigma-K factor RskA